MASVDIRNNRRSWELEGVAINKAMISRLAIENSKGFDTFIDAYYDKDLCHVICLKLNIMLPSIAKKSE